MGICRVLRTLQRGQVKPPACSLHSVPRNAAARGPSALRCGNPILTCARTDQNVLTAELNMSGGYLPICTPIVGAGHRSAAGRKGGIPCGQHGWHRHCCTQRVGSGYAFRQVWGRL